MFYIAALLQRWRLSNLKMRKFASIKICSKQQGLTQITVKIPFVTRLLIGGLQLVIILAAFLLMLLIMSFNVWVFVVAMIGLGVGKAGSWHIPSPKLEKIVSVSSGSAVYVGTLDHCCTQCQ